MTKFKPKIESKRWKPEDEEALLELWSSEDTYEFNPDSEKEIYSVDTPPPYLSGPMHVGQVIHYTQIDMIARYRRMQDWEANFPLGIDRNGLPVEVRVEKEIKKSMHDIPREEFLQLCKDKLDEDEEIVLESFKRLGIAFNTYEDEGSYRTDSPKYRAITQQTFIDIWNKGLVYKDIRPNNWCFDCGTTIADAEVEYKERPAKLYYLHFEVDGKEPIPIATTRPELLCACGAVFIHPDDDRYHGYGGRNAKVPLFGQDVPIIESSTAQMEFGTGALMVCSYGDMADVMAFRDYALTPIAAISPDGIMTDAADIYAGMKVDDAKQKIAEDLETQGLLYKTEETIQRWITNLPNLISLVGEYSERIVGYGAIFKYSHPRRIGTSSLGMYLHQDFHNVGLGSHMLLMLLEQATKENLKRIDLHVIEGNTIAVHLYKKFQFEEEGRLKQAYRGEDGQYHDELIMARLLKKNLNP